MWEDTNTILRYSKRITDYSGEIILYDLFHFQSVKK